MVDERAFPPFPGSYRVVRFDSLDSTNAEALRLAVAGSAGGVWIVAGEQRLGRGRSGRHWASPPGNLYASLLLRPRCSAAQAACLSLLFAVAAHEAISTASAGRISAPQLALKWPNDILIGNAKAGGILLESAGQAGQDGYALTAGIGLNIGQPPEIPSRPVTQLCAHHPNLDPEALFRHLAASCARWLDLWQDGKNFAAIRTAWLARAYGLGDPITVHAGKEPVEGIFLGIDDGGALRLGAHGGDGERRIAAGDVFFASAI